MRVFTNVAVAVGAARVGAAIVDVAGTAAVGGWFGTAIGGTVGVGETGVSCGAQEARAAPTIVYRIQRRRNSRRVIILLPLEIWMHLNQSRCSRWSKSSYDSV